jgi:hypothetical protein
LLESKDGLDLENCNVSLLVETLKGDDPKVFLAVKSYAIRVENADRMWALSEKLTGVRFEFQTDLMIDH